MSLLMRRRALMSVIKQDSSEEVDAWIARVVSNGGTVSSTTRDRVIVLLNAIYDNGLRDKFLRLNLFAGTGLDACLSPLILAESWPATFYGNIYDTNVNFLEADYNESGASGGLQGNGSTKYLNTGFNPSTISALESDKTAALVYSRTAAIPSTPRFLFEAFSGPPNTSYAFVPYDSVGGMVYRLNNPNNIFGGAPASYDKLFLSYRQGLTTKLFQNGVIAATNSQSDEGKPNAEVGIFARVGGTLPSNALLNCYAILNNVEDDTQAALISTLINDFYVDYSRNEYNDPIEVFLFAASQSNMNGQGLNSDISGGTYDGYLGEKTNVKIYGALTSGVFENYEAGVNARTTAVVGYDYGPECAFLQDMQASLGKTVYGIKYSPGGVGLKEQIGENDWNVNSSGELYELFFKNSVNDSYCKLALDILLAANPNTRININALICANGERDAQLSSTTFEGDLNAIINQAKTDLSGYSSWIKTDNMKVVINRVKTSISTTIRTAQENFDYVNSDDIPFKVDNIHYTSEGTIVLGQRMATKYLSLL